MTKLPFVLAALAALTCGAAFADTVVFKTGQEVEGTVLDRGDRVEVKILEGMMTYRKDLIREIRKTASPVAWYDAQTSKLASTDAAGHFRLAIDCVVRKLYKPALAELKIVLAADPGHAGAHAISMDRYSNRRWLTEDEAMRVRGYVRANPKASTDDEVRRALDQMLAEVDRCLKLFGTAATAEARAETIEGLGQIQQKSGMPAVEIAALLAKAPPASVRGAKLLRYAELTAQILGAPGERPPDARWISAARAGTEAEAKRQSAREAAVDAAKRAEAERIAAEAARVSAEAARIRELETGGRFTYCGKCRGRIPDGVKACPHCSTAPTVLPSIVPPSPTESQR